MSPPVCATCHGELTVEQDLGSVIAVRPCPTCRTKKPVTEMDALRERSGNVVLQGKLTAFLYELLRDHVPVGTVEKIVQDGCPGGDVTYTNGWLAHYAEDLARRLTR